MPAHLLGNMWALTWDGVWDHIKPYPGLFYFFSHAIESRTKIKNAYLFEVIFQNPEVPPFLSDLKTITPVEH